RPLHQPRGASGMTTATRGLFSNGRLLWCRVPRPLSGGAPVRRSTGTSDPALAADVLATVRHMARQPSLWDVLEGAAEGRIPLLSLHGHWVRGEVGVLRESAAEAASEAARAAADPDIEPLARRWEAEAVPLLPCGTKQRADYVFQLRCLIPPNVPFHASQWTEDHLQVVLSQQVNARTGAPLSPSTARRYVTAWQQFGKWLRKKVTLPHDPFVDGDWIPSNAPPR